MLTVTPDAAAAIRSILESSELPQGGLRIYAQPVNDTQASLELELAPGPAPGDEVVEEGGATVYLEPSAAAYLSDKTLDATTEGEGVRFRIEQGPPPGPPAT